MIGSIMKAWIARTIAAVSLPMVAGCPDDTTSATGDDGSTGPTATDPTLDDSTGDVPTPATTGMETSSGVTNATTMDTATTDPPPPPTCGNNVIEGDEVCDLTQINGETCESLGSEGGVLGCLLDCSDYNLLGCFICGNDVIDMRLSEMKWEKAGMEEYGGGHEMAEGAPGSAGEQQRGVERS